VVGGELLLLDSTTQSVYSLAVSDVVDHSDDFRSLTVSSAAAGFAVRLCEEGLAATTTSGLSRRALVGTGGAAVGAGLLALSLPTAAAASSAPPAIGELISFEWASSQANNNTDITFSPSIQVGTDRVALARGIDGTETGPQPAPYPTSPLPSPALTGTMTILGVEYPAQLVRYRYNPGVTPPDGTEVGWIANVGTTVIAPGTPFLVTYTFNGVSYVARDS